MLLSSTGSKGKVIQEATTWGWLSKKVISKVKIRKKRNWPKSTAIAKGRDASTKATGRLTKLCKGQQEEDAAEVKPVPVEAES